jgi:hypothetical protein
MPSSTISAYALRFPGLFGSTRRSRTVTVGLFKFLYLYPNQSSQKGKPLWEVQVPREAFSVELQARTPLKRTRITTRFAKDGKVTGKVMTYIFIASNYTRRVYSIPRH